MAFSSVLGASSVIKPGVCTSTTRPSVPYDGQLIYETDTNLVKAFDGTAFVTVGPTVGASYQYAEVLTLQSTSSSSYTDLATPGPAITATTGTTALVTFTATVDGTTLGNDQTQVSVAVSGATTVAPSDSYSLNSRLGDNFVTMSRTYKFAGLTAGSNTFTLKYKNGSSVGCRFMNRGLVVWGF